MSRSCRITVQSLGLAAVFLMTAALAAGGEEPASVVAEARPFSIDIERPGTFVPGEARAIQLWPEAYTGELLILDVLPHGTPLNQGDIVARLDTRIIDDQIRQAELDAETAAIQHRNTAERAEIDEEFAKAAAHKARVALERAQRSLEGWEKYELAFKHRQNEMSAQWAQHSIEDQKDELAQLEAMYRDDELTDATEEIVLKRSRRNLARSITNQKLQHDRRQYDGSYSEPVQTQMKVDQVDDQKRNLDKLLRTQQMDRRTRMDGLVRSEHSLAKKRDHLEKLRRDRELLTIKADRNGILLHGSPENYRPGSVPPRHEKGSRAAAKKTLFAISHASKLEIALVVPESKVFSMRPGMAVKISAAADPEKEIVGTLHVERFPSPKSATAQENNYDASARFDASLPGILPGMRATVKIVTEKMDSAIVVPKAAVFGSGDGAHCYAAEYGSSDFRKVEVKLGPSDGKEIVIQGGIEVGDRLLLSKPE